MIRSTNELQNYGTCDTTLEGEVIDKGFHLCATPSGVKKSQTTLGAGKYKSSAGKWAAWRGFWPLSEPSRTKALKARNGWRVQSKRSGFGRIY